MKCSKCFWNVEKKGCILLYMNLIDFIDNTGRNCEFFIMNISKSILISNFKNNNSIRNIPQEKKRSLIYQNLIEKPTILLFNHIIECKPILESMKEKFKDDYERILKNIIKAIKRMLEKAYKEKNKEINNRIVIATAIYKISDRLLYPKKITSKFLSDLFNTNSVSMNFYSKTYLEDDIFN